MCQLICPNLRCRKVLKVSESTRGSTVRCQHCQTQLRVPPARRTAPWQPTVAAASRPQVFAR